MKRTPRLTFQADPAIAAGSRVEELLRGLHGGVPGRRVRGRRRRGDAGERRTGRAGEPSPAWWSSTRRPAGPRTTWWPAAAASSGSAGWATPARSTPTPPASCWSGWAGPPGSCASSPRCPRPTRRTSCSGTRDVDARRLGRGRSATYDMSHVTPDAVRRGRRRAHRGDRAGAADGVGRQGRAAAGCTSWPARASRSSARPGRSPSTASTTEPDPARPGVYRAEVECSSGTYIRVLAQDLGRALGRRRARGQPAAHPHRLVRRGRHAPARRASAPTHVLTPAQAMRDLDSGDASTPSAAASIRTGLPLDRVPLGAAGDGPWAMLDEAGRAAGRLRGDRHRPHPAGRGAGRASDGRPTTLGRDAAR